MPSPSNSRIGNMTYGCVGDSGSSILYANLKYLFGNKQTIEANINEVPHAPNRNSCQVEKSGILNPFFPGFKSKVIIIGATIKAARKLLRKCLTYSRSSEDI